MYVTIIKNRGHEFERDQGQVYRRVGRSEREEGNYIIIFLKYIRNNF